MRRGTDDVAINSDCLWSDAAAFEEALAAKDFSGALEIYSGNLLPGFFIAGAPHFERWVEDERARLLGCAVGAGRVLVRRAIAGKDPTAAVHWARATSRLAPLNEADLRTLMELVSDGGDRIGATNIYDLFVERLANDYDLEPSTETRTLMASIRQGGSRPILSHS
jgi:DNA-binding SARP family transcriptional activator